MNETETDTLYIALPSPHEWSCWLFGGTPENCGIVWHPAKGKQPNWFWRWMQYLFFGNRWKKNY